MKIEEVMCSEVVYARPDNTVEEVARLMAEYDIGSVPVCDGDMRLCGIVTDRDIVLRNVAGGESPGEILARDVMTSDMVTVDPSADVRTVSKIMADRQVRRIPVVDKECLVGMVALGDLANSRGLFSAEASEALTEISKCKSK